MRRFTALLLAAALVLGMGAAPAAAATSQGTLLTTPVTGTFNDVVNGGTGTFTGTFSLTSFRLVNGALAAVGTLTGTLTNSLGQTVGTVTRQVTLPVTATGSCQILHLELGPLDLNLLGLQVHLNRIVLDITAQSGPGNLLGNLLCAIAGLLDANTGLNQLVGLLNQLLGILRGL